MRRSIGWRGWRHRVRRGDRRAAWRRGGRRGRRVFRRAIPRESANCARTHPTTPSVCVFAFLLAKIASAGGVGEKRVLLVPIVGVVLIAHIDARLAAAIRSRRAQRARPRSRPPNSAPCPPQSPRTRRSGRTGTLCPTLRVCSVSRTHAPARPRSTDSQPSQPDSRSASTVGASANQTAVACLPAVAHYVHAP
jgi:hypothetical protein